MSNIQCMKFDVFYTTNLQETWVTAAKQYEITFALTGKDENTMHTFFRNCQTIFNYCTFNEYMYFMNI